MPRITHLAFTVALIFSSALLSSAQAQTPRVSTINISAQSDKVHITAEGDVAEMRIEVVSEAGDIVFESGAITGNTLDWNMRDTQGARVQPGTYLMTVTFRHATGKLRKRVEQVVVAEAEKSETQATQTAMAAPEAVQAAITGAGTANRLAKFTGAATIGNSIITESAAKIGINQPAPKHALSIGNGPLWTPKNWGGALELQNAAAIGWKPNSGGWSFGMGHSTGGFYLFRTKNAPGTKTATGTPVNDLTITDAGNVGIGTTSPVARLGVSTSTKSTANNTAYFEAPNIGPYASNIHFGPNGDWYIRSAAAAGKVILQDTGGNVGIGTAFPSLGKLHVDGGSVAGVFGRSDSRDGVFGISGTGNGVFGSSSSGNGVFGYSDSGYAGFFSGQAKVTDNLEVGSCTGCSPPSDRHLKANFSSVNPRFILDRLASIPIQTWNYKSEPASVRHIGAMAQDFRSAFQFGADDKTLNTVDAQGVTMAAIQGLYQMMQEKERKNEQLASEVQQLRSQVVRLQRAVKQQRKVRR